MSWRCRKLPHNFNSPMHSSIPWGCSSPPLWWPSSLRHSNSITMRASMGWLMKKLSCSFSMPSLSICYGSSIPNTTSERLSVGIIVGGQTSPKNKQTNSRKIFPMIWANATHKFCKLCGLLFYTPRSYRWAQCYHLLVLSYIIGWISTTCSGDQLCPTPSKPNFPSMPPNSWS